MSPTEAVAEPWIEVTGSRHFADWLAEQRVSLAFTTYQAGMRTFAGVVLRTAGDQTITATDTVDGSVMGSLVVTVTPAAADHLAFETISKVKWT